MSPIYRANAPATNIEEYVAKKRHIITHVERNLAMYYHYYEDKITIPLIGWKYEDEDCANIEYAFDMLLRPEAYVRTRAFERFDALNRAYAELCEFPIAAIPLRNDWLYNDGRDSEGTNYTILTMRFVPTELWRAIEKHIAIPMDLEIAIRVHHLSHKYIEVNAQSLAYLSLPDLLLFKSAFDREWLHVGEMSECLYGVLYKEQK